MAVVIPALNEEHAIGGVIDAIPRGAIDPPWTLDRIVVVDNGSVDRTAGVARARGAMVIAEGRRGYGSACLAGIRHLERRPPDIVAFLDADHSDDPSELPLVLGPLLELRADLVIGSRVLGEREPGSLTPLQEFGNRLATGLLAVLFGARATDLGPFRAIRWDSLVRIPMSDRDYGWTVEMQALAAAGGLRTTEVPVTYRRRRAGRSKVSGSIRGALAAGWKILYTIARVRLGHRGHRSGV